MLGPVVDDLAGGARQNGRCQSLHAHPRQNQEAAVVDDILQVPSALGRVPTNPLIAGGHRPGWTRPLKASEYLTTFRIGNSYSDPDPRHDSRVENVNGLWQTSARTGKKPIDSVEQKAPQPKLLL